MKDFIMQSLFIDCCNPAYGLKEESNIHQIENLREVMGRRMMEIDEPLSPRALDRVEKATNRRFESPERLVRSSPLRCPNAPRKKQRAMADDDEDDDDQVYANPTNSFSSVPFFPFERTNSISSTQTVCPPMVLLPKFEDPVLIESLNNEHPPILIEPDEEREPVQVEDEGVEGARQEEPDARQK